MNNRFDILRYQADVTAFVEVASRIFICLSLVADTLQLHRPVKQ
jgi:hypothetical protein